METSEHEKDEEQGQKEVEEEMRGKESNITANEENENQKMTRIEVTKQARRKNRWLVQDNHQAHRCDT